jgi:hypothetical protein
MFLSESLYGIMGSKYTKNRYNTICQRYVSALEHMRDMLLQQGMPDILC